MFGRVKLETKGKLSWKESINVTSSAQHNSDFHQVTFSNGAVPWCKMF